MEVPTEVFIVREKDKIMALFAEVDTQPGLAFVSCVGSSMLDALK